MCVSQKLCTCFSNMLRIIILLSYEYVVFFGYTINIFATFSLLFYSVMLSLVIHDGDFYVVWL